MKTLKRKNEAEKTAESERNFMFFSAKGLWIILIVLSILNCADSFAQVNSGPVYPPNRAIPAGQSYDPANPFPDQWNYFPHLKNPLLQQNQTQTQEQNKLRMQQLGYLPPPEQAQMTVDYTDRLAMERQMKKQKLYALINADNNNGNSVNPKKADSENYPDEATKRLLHMADTNSLDYKMHFKSYDNAYAEIVNMLSGKTALNLKRAVFLVENAYHKNGLNYEKYCNQIDELVFICKTVMREKELDPDYFIACHFAIQQLFSEKFNYKNKDGKTLTFEPFSYDFIDPFGDNDQTKGFVTKLLNSKTGQCHSLPLLYLIIAEELRANAFLSFAPNHSYVIFGNQYQSFNFETTNGTFVTDEWIIRSGYISPTAVKNGIYLTPVAKQQIIAECLLDLSDALAYTFGKSNFGFKCANTTLSYFPNSIHAILNINNMLVAACAKTAYKYKFPAEEDYIKYPELKKQFDQMVEYELKVEQTGYSRIPEETYEKWQRTVNEEKERQEHLKLVEKLKQSAIEK